MIRKYSLYSIILGIFFVLIIAVFVSIYFSVNQHRENLTRTSIDEKITLASSINEITSSTFLLWFYRTALVGEVEKVFITEIAKAKDIRYIKVIDINGTIKQSTIEGEDGEINEDPDIKKAISSKRVIIRDEILGKEKLKTIIYPGYNDKTIWISFSLENVEDVIRSMIFRELGILAILILVIVFIFMVLRNSIINPLKEMTLACEEIGKNNLDVKIKTESKTEIGELINTFNKMITDLKESKISLEESKKVLEIKVTARTRELQELTENLEEKVKERTKQLQERVTELEAFHRVTVGRETKMMELKKKIKELEQKLKG
jgi:methyl-accepting chemotaxis protein